MKLIGWAIAIAAALATPAAAQTATTTNQPAVQGGQQATQPVSETGANALPPPTSEPFVYAAPTPGIGEPVPGGMGAQVQVSEIGQQAANFHDYWLLTLCAAITLIVLGLLAFAMVRFRRSAHATPSRTAHNTVIEVIWTVIPVLILVAIAIPSIRLMRAQYSFPAADVTIKVVGNQWFWTYEYPDHGGFELVSNMLKEKNDPTLRPGERTRTDADGPPMLAVDERVVIPAGQVVKFIVTANDVIHAFAMPAFGIKTDAVPGRINEVWFKAEKEGLYYGQCSELCGKDHAFMPIAIRVVSQQQYDTWLTAAKADLTGANKALMAAVDGDKSIAVAGN